MKSISLVFSLLLAALATAQEARIKIDINRVISAIDPRIYGVFMEPIEFSGARLGLGDSVRFNTLYGTLYDPESPLANDDGFRNDYIDAMQELKVTNMRWPGGNFLMAYNWKDGIGPKADRPVRVNMAWGGIESNHVGTDEWIALNQAMGSENVICVNLGLGTIEDAAHWVEYCNYPGGTYYSDLRASNGHQAPYSVKIWGLGNEVDGYPWELGYKSVDDYVKVGREAAKAMKAIDGNIELVACGSSWYSNHGSWVDWNRKVVEELGDISDYLSIHRYWERSDDYYTFMGASALDFEEKIIVTADIIRASSAKKGFEKSLEIAVDEWGVFARNFRSVLPVAQSFNTFLRNADVVKMANYTLMTSLLSRDPVHGTYKSPLFYTFKAYSTNCLGSAIDTYVQCDTFNTMEYKGIPYLDVSATYQPESKTAVINVVNRHKDASIMTEILCTTGQFIGNAETTLIVSEDLTGEFEYEERASYVPAVVEVETHDGSLTHTFPAHSFTQIQVKVQD